MVGGKPDTSKSNSRKKRESLGINQLEKPVEAGDLSNSKGRNGYATHEY